MYTMVPSASRIYQCSWWTRWPDFDQVNGQLQEIQGNLADVIIPILVDIRVDEAGVRLTDRIFAMSAYSSTNGEKSLVFLVIAGMSSPQIARRTNDMHQSQQDTLI